MTMSDPIADMLTRIRNANTAKHDTVDVPSSKMKLAIANILLDEGYIEKYDIVEDGVFKTIHITLKYGADKNEKVITGARSPAVRHSAQTLPNPFSDGSGMYPRQARQASPDAPQMRPAPQGFRLILFLT